MMPWNSELALVPTASVRDSDDRPIRAMIIHIPPPEVIIRQNFFMIFPSKYAYLFCFFFSALVQESHVPWAKPFSNSVASLRTLSHAAPIRMCLTG
jgi:hypothetical protein